MYIDPFIIDFPKVGTPALGYISIAENDLLPFIPKRIYWTYFTPENVTRGGHSHLILKQILVAVSGKIEIKIINRVNKNFHFILENPNKGIFIPEMCWREMKYSHNSVQMCIASEVYSEEDYIRDFEVFNSYIKSNKCQ